MKIENRSGLVPKGEAVLLFPYSPDLYVKTTRIIIPESHKRQLRMIENRGIVIEIGPEAWRGREPRAVVGEKVMFSKHAGAAAVGEDGLEYRVVNADDIFLGIVDNVPLEKLFPEQAEPCCAAPDAGFGLAQARREGAPYVSRYASQEETEEQLVSYGESQIDPDTMAAVNRSIYK